MGDFSQLLRQGAGHAWLFLPSAILLGALHGLEPGHSKTMMAAFIVAVRGTVQQAVLLGVSAAFSHTLVIWILAAVALQYGSRWNADTTEPYFQLASAVIIGGLAAWMLWRTRRDLKASAAHSHSHREGGHESHMHQHPHTAPLHEEETHHHADLPVCADFQDAHEREHAQEIQNRFGDRQVTTGQIILFGLTGGLLPCPAAFSILIICLQLKKLTLGFSLVAAFSFGLAITLVTSGSIAAWSVRHAERKFRGFGEFARKLPYLSSAFLLLIALYIGLHGWKALLGHSHN